MAPLTDFEAIKHVLVVKPSSLGDIVHTLPAVEALARRYPQWEIDWVANPEWLPLVKGHPQLHGTIPFPRANLRGAMAPGRFLRWTQQLRAAMDYDLCLDFQGLMRSALIARGSGARWRLGLSDAREGAGLFCQALADVNDRLHAVERYLALAEFCGAAPCLGKELPLPHLPKGSCPEAAAGQGLERGEFVVLHPWSRGQGKSLERADIKLVLEELAPRRVVLVGRIEHSQLLENLPTHVLDLSNQTTLPELCWVLARAAATISVDSGPMHLAAAFSAPLLALHAWSDPRKVGPWKTEAAVWKAGQFATRTTIDPDLAAGVGELGRPAAEAVVEWVRGLKSE